MTKHRKQGEEVEGKEEEKKKTARKPGRFDNTHIWQEILSGGRSCNTIKVDIVPRHDTILISVLK